MTEDIEALKQENERLRDMNNALQRTLENEKAALALMYEKNNTLRQKLSHQNDIVRQQGSDIRKQSERIGQLAASNFGLRLRLKTAQKQIKQMLKADKKARKMGITHS